MDVFGTIIDVYVGGVIALLARAIARCSGVYDNLGDYENYDLDDWLMYLWREGLFIVFWPIGVTIFAVKIIYLLIKDIWES